MPEEFAVTRHDPTESPAPAEISAAWRASTSLLARIILTRLQTRRTTGEVIERDGMLVLAPTRDTQPPIPPTQ